MMVQADQKSLQELVTFVQNAPPELALIIILGADWFDQNGYLFDYNALVLETANQLNNELAQVWLNRNMKTDDWRAK